MTSYETVGKALQAGADPAMLCQTCPWDRYCIAPPTMTRAEVDAQIEKAKRDDEAKAGPDGKGMPMGSLITMIAIGGRDTMAQICPVFALRLRSSSGRAIAEATKTQMQNWDDQETGR